MATKSKSIISMSPAFLSQSKSTLVDFGKPYRNEALVRMRNNTAGFGVLFLLTNLLPIPTIWTSLKVILSERSSSTVWTLLLSGSELALFGLFALNMLQAAIALKYPRRPLPPMPSPAKALPMSPPSQSTRTRLFSPNSSPQSQKSFSSSYIASPKSTPSRTLQYSSPTIPSPFNASINSSTISMPQSPSPSISSPLAAYRGRHSQSTGHAFNGSLLSRLAHDSDEED
ncbi:hypothetical protein BJ138DRAFT_132791 [Hygrophoropsis aurantiaca]|uniref:Uncharacterized protein n=1 Tax=Hygrophoropsis aurantiaca TaxID=72124 RepID=A0ACB8AC34_9AGAM|nr:hypothetical protein BJ138DRAFT_132791 [Hygrophoropsis aurantiaca]